MTLAILTSQNQTTGAAQNISSSTTAAALNPSSITAMTQAATDLTAAGSNLLKLNEQATSAAAGLLPNSTLTIDPTLSTAKTGLEKLFSAQGATATATDFFRAARETATKVTNDVKSITEKLMSGVNTNTIISKNNLASLTNIMSTAAAAAATGGRYIPGAGTALQQTGSKNTAASAAISSTLGALQLSGVNSGVNTAQTAVANPAVTSAIGSLSSAAKISAPGVALPTGLSDLTKLAGVTIPAVDPLQYKAAVAAVDAAQNPPNPLAAVGAKIGAVDRSKLDSAFQSILPPGLPAFNPGVPSAAAAATAALNSARFKDVKDQDLNYSGQDPIVWDEINRQRLARGLTGLSTPRPAADSDYVKKYSSPAYTGG